MKAKQKLIIEQLDRKLLLYATVPETPQKGWIHVIRTGLKMSLRQLAQRLGVTPPSAKEIEDREKNGSITIKSLKEAARALNMKLVYGLVPTDGTLEAMINQKAEEVARKIVSRTSSTMKLEDQSVSNERIEKSIKDLAAEIKNEMPKVSMGLDLQLIDGQTPLDEEESEGLLIPGITTRGELDEFEQLNIERAIKWSLGKRLSPEQILTEEFVKQVHQKMYEDVWRWAGKFRKSDKNIGVPWAQIAVGLKYLLDDCSYWIKNETFSPDELAVRFKHRIVQVHCFSNGNGRHSRLMADLIVTNVFGFKPFSWGGNLLVDEGHERSEYLKAIKAADQGNITPLVEFSRK